MQSTPMGQLRGAVDLPPSGGGFMVNQHCLATTPASVGRQLGGLLTIPDWWYVWLMAIAPTCLPSHHTGVFCDIACLVVLQGFGGTVDMK
jgi:hypothetical protein